MQADLHLQQKLLTLFAARKGHFKLESNHHGELWLDLELLCLNPQAVRPFAARLAQLLARHDVEVVCGPLVEGAFMGLMVAAELGVEFCYSERFDTAREGLFPVEYRLPTALRPKVRGKRVAIVNDVINAGSSVRGTLRDLSSCCAETVALGSLLVLGTAAKIISRDTGLSLECLAAVPNEIWIARDCPLCAAGAPLDELAH